MSVKLNAVCGSYIHPERQGGLHWVLELCIRKNWIIQNRDTYVRNTVAVVAMICKKWWVSNLMPFAVHTYIQNGKEDCTRCWSYQCHLSERCGEFKIEIHTSETHLPWSQWSVRFDEYQTDCPCTAHTYIQSCKKDCTGCYNWLMSMDQIAYYGVEIHTSETHWPLSQWSIRYGEYQKKAPCMIHTYNRIGKQGCTECQSSVECVLPQDLNPYRVRSARAVFTVIYRDALALWSKLHIYSDHSHPELQGGLHSPGGLWHTPWNRLQYAAVCVVSLESSVYRADVLPTPQSWSSWHYVAWPSGSLDNLVIILYPYLGGGALLFADSLKTVAILCKCVMCALAYAQ